MYLEVHRGYSDDVLPRIADACSAVLADKRRSPDQFLAEFGRIRTEICPVQADIGRSGWIGPIRADPGERSVDPG